MKRSKPIVRGEPFPSTPLDPKSAKAQGFLWRHRYGDSFDTIQEAYKRPSYTKTRAFDIIRQECVYYHGVGLRVHRGNMYMFSASYILTDDDGNEWLIYHTPAYRYAIPWMKGGTL